MSHREPYSTCYNTFVHGAHDWVKVGLSHGRVEHVGKALRCPGTEGSNPQKSERRLRVPLEVTKESRERGHDDD